MKHLFNTLKMLMALFVSTSIFISCQKEIKTEPAAQNEISTASSQTHGHLQQTKTFSSEVAQKWQDMQLRILRLPQGANPFGLNGNRYFAYCGIALYESVVPGMPSYQSLYGQLTDMPEMPDTEPGQAYHWPTSVNAALGHLNKQFYTTANTSTANVASMDSLENALNVQYEAEVNNAATFQRSKSFGRMVAERIFTWSTTDGSLNSNPPFVSSPLPLWQPTAPNPTAVFAAYWGNNRLFVQGSLTGTSSPLPPAYSTTPGSDYYNMVKEVYDVSQSLTPGQIATALYFRDNPGFQAGTHYISIFDQVMDKENLQLDQYALAHVKTGISIAEAQIGCWKIKYDVLLDRPIRYIRNILGHTTWTPLLTTPPHPDYPSGHSQTGGAFSAVSTHLFGNNYPITLHTYDNLGMAPRSYSSFNEMAIDIGRSRVYAGIHYTYSFVEGKNIGERIATNVLRMLKFKKD